MPAMRQNVFFKDNDDDTTTYLSAEVALLTAARGSKELARVTVAGARGATRQGSLQIVVPRLAQEIADQQKMRDPWTRLPRH